MNVNAPILPRLVALERKLPARLADYFRTLPPQIQKYVERFIDTSPNDDPGWRQGSKLGTRSGGILEALRQGGKGNITALTTKGAITNLGYGIDPRTVRYAQIQHDGGFIASRGKMHRFFWARYAETGNSFFKVMALSVLKRRGVSIKPKPFFDPAIALFIRDASERVDDDLAYIILSTYATTA